MIEQRYQNIVLNRIKCKNILHIKSTDLVLVVMEFSKIKSPNQ